MYEQEKLTLIQLGLLTQFATKHNIQEIKLNQAESRYFFDFLEASLNLESSRILLQPAFAEGRSRSTNGDLQIVIITKRQILNSPGLSWEAGFNEDQTIHTNPFTQKLFDIFIQKMGYEILLSKLAFELKDLYPLSQGQAKAVMIKLLGFRLSSGTRSFLHDLRNKIRKYEELIMNFKEYVILPADNIKTTLQTFTGELVSKFSNGEIGTNLDKIIPESKITGHTEKTQQLLKRQAEIVQGKEMPKIEKGFYLQDSPSYEYVCLDCNNIILIKVEHLDTHDILQIPEHCGNSMTVRLKT